MRRQAILSLDVRTWKQLVETFDIKQGMIEHRSEAHTAPGAQGWYS